MSNTNADPHLERFRKACRAHGLRVTPQRVAIYRELLNSHDHPSCEAIFDRLRQTFPDISFDTVYRSMAAFHDIGLVDMVDGFGTTMRFDPKLDRHHHFRCRKCSRIIDFDEAGYDTLKAPDPIAAKCEVLKVQVTVEGICEQCRKKRSK